MPRYNQEFGNSYTIDEFSIRRIYFFYRLKFG